MFKRIKRNKIVTIVVLILIVLCLCLLFIVLKKNGSSASVSLQENKQEQIKTQHPEQKASDSMPTVIIDSAPELVVPRQVTHPKKTAHRMKATVVAIDTTIKQDSLIDTNKNVLGQDTVSRCVNDTVSPWVYPDPSGGLHRNEVIVTFGSTKPCTIEWKLDNAQEYQLYRGDSIKIAKTSSLYFRAHDSCGNSMPEREEHYEIKVKEISKVCSKDMEFIQVGATRFCIDRYEWPNKKGVVPMSYVSLYNAMDSCVSLGKKLCTSDEWTLACSGPYGWQYPYGAGYEPHACITQDTTARKSGSKAECRGYFDVFDMAGNLAEWTNTKASRNPQFYNVKGGFWDSGSKSTCYESRYSYYPQNRHNPVGFRCCKDALKE